MKMRKEKRIISSICCYCGCACRLNFVVEGNKIVEVLPDKTDLVSQGKPCIKGLTLNEPILKNRIRFPLIKNKRVSWEKAYEYIYKKLKKIKPKEIGFIGSGEYSNEDNFLLSKFARIVFKTSNIDSCARLCHAATAIAFQNQLGLAAMPGYLNDLLDADLIFTIGTNPASNYPVAFNRILEAKKKGAKLISIHFEPSLTSKLADLSLNIPLYGISAIVSGLIHLLIKNKDYEKKIEKIEGFKDLKESVQIFTPEFVTAFCRIHPEELDQIYKLIKKAKNMVVMHGMGVTQHADGLENVKNILNLALLKEAKIVPMRGKVNIQGAGDLGVCPDFLPFGGSKSLIKKNWGIELEKPGRKMTEFIFDKNLKALFVLGGNPAQSFPALEEVHQNLKRIFLVYIHHHFSETSKFADVILPSTILFESEGTITSAERRIRWVRPVRKISKNIKYAWKIFSDLGVRFGYKNQFSYSNPKEIFEEITRSIPAYTNLSWNQIKVNQNIFAEKEIKFKKFVRVRDSIPYSVPPKRYPFVLTTTRSRYHFCTGELTRATTKLKELEPKAFCYLNPIDGAKLKVKNGDKIKVISKISSVIAEVKLKEDVKIGTCIIPFHFENILVNKLVPRKKMIDPISGTPNLKAIFVRLEPIK